MLTADTSEVDCAKLSALCVGYRTIERRLQGLNQPRTLVPHFHVKIRRAIYQSFVFIESRGSLILNNYFIVSTLEQNASDLNYNVL